jgi:transposase-like protein
MAKKTFTTEQIISKLREVELLLSQGQTAPAVCKVIRVTDQTYYRWRNAY